MRMMRFFTLQIGHFGNRSWRLQNRGVLVSLFTQSEVFVIFRCWRLQNYPEIAHLFA